MIRTCLTCALMMTSRHISAAEPLEQNFVFDPPIRLIEASAHPDPASSDAILQKQMVIELYQTTVNLWNGTVGWVAVGEVRRWPDEWTQQDDGKFTAPTFLAESTRNLCPDGAGISEFRIVPMRSGSFLAEICGMQVEMRSWEGMASWWNAWRNAQAIALLEVASKQLSGLSVVVGESETRVELDGAESLGACALVSPGCALSPVAAACVFPGGRALIVVAPTGQAPLQAVIQTDLSPEIISGEHLAGMCSDARVALPGIHLPELGYPFPRPPRPDLRQILKVAPDATGGARD